MKSFTLRKQYCLSVVSLLFLEYCLSVVSLLFLGKDFIFMWNPIANRARSRFKRFFWFFFCRHKKRTIKLVKKEIQFLLFLFVTFFISKK